MTITTSAPANTGARPAAPTRDELLAYALAYAARGWHVFPLRPLAKGPAVPDHREDRCTRAHPRCQDGHTGWEQRATTDPDRITRCWSRGAYGIGIACGPSGLLVVDLDPPKPGFVLPDAWADTGVVTGVDVFGVLLARHDSPWADTRTVATPRGGLHLYFTHPAGPRLGNTAGSLAPLIDTRGWGGYVAAPPTVTTDPDGTYTAQVDTGQAAPVPSWLAGLLRPARVPDRAPARPVRPCQGPRVSRYGAAALARETDRVRGASPGSRNVALFTAAVALGQLVGAGALAGDEVTVALMQASADHVHAGAFTPSEAAGTIASGLRRGTAEPRTLPRTAAAGARR